MTKFIERFEQEHGMTGNSKPMATEGGGQESALEKINPLEKLSLLKMVLAMVIDFYGYDPNDKKSPIPKEIADVVMSKLDVSIDIDTVRKFLKEAAKLNKIKL